MNAYVAPALERYLANVERRADAVKARAPIQVVRSDGGPDEPRGRRAGTPSRRCSRGPPAASAAPRWSRRAQASSASSPSTWAAPRPTSRSASPAGPRSRARRGSATSPCALPAVDVASIGAGGGSIANVAEVTGALRVGPQSAGAVPGPACYGHGGHEATVTDANVVLGHLPPRLLGGEMSSTSMRRTPRWRASPRRSARASRRRRARSSTWWTRRCSARCAW